MENHYHSDALRFDAFDARTRNDSWAGHLERPVSAATAIRLRAVAIQPICRSDDAGEPSFFGCAYRIPRDRSKARIEELLSELDLAANRDTKAGRLSDGFRQLLSVSCALIQEPLVLFLDEPTAGLDPVHRQYIWAALQNKAAGYDYLPN